MVGSSMVQVGSAMEETDADKKCSVLVVDTAGFIRNARLEMIGEEIVTVGAVVAEIRDKATRERLQVTPYELQFKEPDQEDLRHGELAETRVIHVVKLIQRSAELLMSDDNAPGRYRFEAGQNYLGFMTLHCTCFLCMKLHLANNG